MVLFIENSKDHQNLLELAIDLSKSQGTKSVYQKFDAFLHT